MSRVGRPRLPRLGRELKTTRQQRRSLRRDHSELNSVLPAGEPVVVRVVDALFGTWVKTARTLVVAAGVSVLVSLVPVDFTVGPVTVTHLEACQVEQSPANFVMSDSGTILGVNVSEPPSRDRAYRKSKAF